MKPLLNILLSILIFGASLQNTLFMIDYRINKNFYEIHCINKAQPQLDCHGKCQMKKEAEKSSAPFNLVKYSFEFNILPTEPHFFIAKKLCFAPLRSYQFNYQDFFFPEYVLGVVPPPPQV